MTIDRIVMAFAGTMVLVGLALAYFSHPWWMVLPAFVGANLIQAAFTRICPLAIVLKRVGVKPGCAFP